MLALFNASSTPLFVPHTTNNTHFPSTSELFQRHSRERYRCANTQTMTIRIWNDGNPMRMVEITSNDHSIHIICNQRHFTFQITHIASPFQWESKLNYWHHNEYSSHRTIPTVCGFYWNKDVIASRICEYDFSWELSLERRESITAGQRDDSNSPFSLCYT